MNVDQKQQVLLLVVIIVLWIGMIAVAKFGENREARLKAEAIERGYAQHNPKTGDWEWIEPPQKQLEKK